MITNSFETLAVGQEDGVLFVQITAPPMNLLGPELVRDLRTRWREILFVELLFLAAFALFVWFRSVNPEPEDWNGEM